MLQPPVSFFVIYWQGFILGGHQVWLDLILCVLFGAGSSFWGANLAPLLASGGQLFRYAVFVEFVSTFEHDEGLHTGCLSLVIAKTHSHALILIVSPTQIESEDAGVQNAEPSLLLFLLLSHVCLKLNKGVIFDELLFAVVAGARIVTGKA